MSSIGKDLRKILGDKQVLDLPEDVSAYANDATFYIAKKNPDAVAVPKTTKDVSEIMKYAFKNKIPVVPRGAGSGLAGGCTPVHGGIVLDMKKKDRILEIDHKNMSATVECGVVLNNFNRELARQGLFYPPDPQSMSVCTLGGNIATRAGGPRGVKYGTTERYVTGLEMVMPDGTVMTPGGKVMKMSSGYDITHLMTGSEGTLGVITSAHLRLLPMPAAKRTIVVTCTTVDQAAEIVSEIIAAGAVPAMLEFLIKLAISVLNKYISPPLPLLGEAYLLMELDGSASQVEDETRDIKRICTGMGAVDVRVVTDDAESATYWWARSRLYPGMLQIFKRVITEDITVPRNSIPEFVRRVQAIAASTGAFIGLAGHAGDGNMHPTILHTEISEEMSKKAEKAIEEIIRAGLDLKGTISGEHGIGIHKNKFTELEHGADQIELMKKIKAAFDPHNIMNPGKIWIEEAR
ncbi:MAG TPA: FAD-linked oxidase C-terminal domain-containing protein [Spirochaetota bacterium]|nr:FAD-binding protein [Spirochaetota bacterium]HQO39540.1 FAD-linked oxidase C-terminal domain-containing protein [Spirochaetota bacterium]